MSVALVLLAVLMGAVTYPSRAIPLLAPGFHRLPPRALEYLRLVGPAVLAAIAAAQVAIWTSANGRPAFHLGVEWLAVAACLACVAWRRSLLLGIVAAVVLVAGLRAAGLG